MLLITKTDIRTWIMWLEGFSEINVTIMSSKELAITWLWQQSNQQQERVILWFSLLWSNKQSKTLESTFQRKSVMQQNSIPYDLLGCWFELFQFLSDKLITRFCNETPSKLIHKRIPATMDCYTLQWRRIDYHKPEGIPGQLIWVDIWGGF